jgi:hypothetical protein
MKHSNTWFVLILIASALILNAASNANALPPNPSKRERATQPQAHSTSGKVKTAPQPCPAVTVVIQQIPPANQTQRITAVIQQDPYKHWWNAPNGPEWALFILTIPYVLITGGLFCLNWKATNIANKGADAAKENARTAEIAFYTTTRPWVLVSDFQIGPYDVGPTVTYKIYNTGPLPALLHGLQIVGHASALEPDQYDRSIDPLDLARSVAIHVPPQTSAKEGFLTQSFSPSLPQADWDDIRVGSKWLYVYGRVTYLGPLNEIWFYYTGFGFWHQGEWAAAKVEMKPMISTKINYVK